MRKYKIYVDQSGKIEERKDTGIAFSQEGSRAESFSRTVVIRKDHKSRIKSKAVSSLGSQHKYRLKLFSLGLYLLTEHDLDRIREIVIDKEYEGNKNLIKTYLYNFYKENRHTKDKSYPEISIDEVHSMVSGTPKCHELCYDARERNIEPDVVSKYSFIKGALLPSPGKGRKTD